MRWPAGLQPTASSPCGRVTLTLSSSQSVKAEPTDSDTAAREPLEVRP
jgi:hypothetical protein